VTQRVLLKLSDLSDVIRVLGKASTNTAAPEEILQVLNLHGQQEQAAMQNATSRWQAAVKVALESESNYLCRLLDEVCERLPAGPRREVITARQDVAIAYIERILNGGRDHPELGDQVEELHMAQDYESMQQAAAKLRDIGLHARRMLMDPQLGGELALQLGTIDPERRRLELADLAIDVVSATDYLLSLAREPVRDSRRSFSIERDIGAPASSVVSPESPSDHDLRYRRALDSRAAAVRLGGRLLRGLRRETVALL
jgi:hypothetical protein